MIFTHQEKILFCCSCEVQQVTDYYNQHDKKPQREHNIWFYLKIQRPFQFCPDPNNYYGKFVYEKAAHQYLKSICGEMLLP